MRPILAVAAIAWCPGLLAAGLRPPDIVVPHLQWATNVATITFTNDDAMSHRMAIDIQTRVEESGGVGWQTEHAIAPNSTAVIRREFFIRPLPGRATVHVVVRVDGRELASRDYRDTFPVDGAPMQSVQISDEHIWRGGSDAVPKTIAAYPPLKRMEREPFVFFYTPGDTFAESHIDGLAAERGGVLQLLKGKIAPSFCGKVAFYLFPDRVTKFGYTLHHGAGWATGRAIVEVFNEHEQLDATHELVHIVASSIGNPPALFREGLAVALQRDAKWDGYSVDAWTRDLKRRNMLMPERQLFVLTDIGPEQTLPAITYPEAGSFMKYLSERFGLDAVLRAYGQLKSADDPHWIAENETKFEHIFGRSVDRAAAEWLAAIDVSTAEPIPAERIEAIRKKINAR